MLFFQVSSFPELPLHRMAAIRYCMVLPAVKNHTEDGGTFFGLPP
jgi:hypothetical protein